MDEGLDRLLCVRQIEEIKIDTAVYFAGKGG